MASGGAKHSADLGALVLRGYEPDAGVQVIWDKALKGFGLRVRGSKDRTTWRWIFKYRHIDGRQVKLTLGSPAAGMTVGEARRLATEARNRRAFPDKDVRTAQKAVVEAARTAAEAQRLGEERRNAEASRPVMELLWERYWASEGKHKKSAASYEQLWCRHLRPAFGDIKVRDLTTETIEDFKVQAAATPGACNRALALLSILLTRAVAWGWRKGCDQPHPIKGGLVARYPERRLEFAFTAEEFAQILMSCDRYGERDEGRQRQGRDEIGLMVRMLAITGARASEVMTSHWGQFSEQPDGCLFWTVEASNTKQGRPITRYLDADLSKRLLEWRPMSLALTAQPKVITLGAPRWAFPNARDPARPVPRLRNAWEKIKGRASLRRPEAKTARIHDLRHTAATLLLLNNGGDLSLVKEQLGHATILTTQRYAHVLPKAAARTGALMGEIVQEALAVARAKEAANASVIRL